MKIQRQVLSRSKILAQQPRRITRSDHSKDKQDIKAKNKASIKRQHYPQELDERKILRDFQLKRKQLMRVIKQKQKTKQAQQINQTVHQHKEGIKNMGPKNQEKLKIVLSQPNTQNKAIKKQQSQIDRLNDNQQCLNSNNSRTMTIGIQTLPIQQSSEVAPKFIRQNNKIQPLIQLQKQEKQVIVDRDVVKTSKVRASRQRQSLDIDKIRQIVTKQVKIDQSNVQSLSSFNSSSKNLSKNQLISAPYINHIENQIDKINEKIQSFFNNKKLKPIILGCYKYKFTKSIKQQCPKKVYKRIKCKKISKKQHQWCVHKQGKRFGSKHLLNDKFKYVLMDENQLKYQVKPKKQQKTSIQHDKLLLQDQDQTKTQIDSLVQWAHQINPIFHMLMEKYPYLQDYVDQSSSNSFSYTKDKLSSNLPKKLMKYKSYTNSNKKESELNSSQNNIKYEDEQIGQKIQQIHKSKPISRRIKKCKQKFLSNTNELQRIDIQKIQDQSFIQQINSKQNYIVGQLSNILNTSNHFRIDTSKDSSQDQNYPQKKYKHNQSYFDDVKDCQYKLSKKFVEISFGLNFMLKQEQDQNPFFKL